MNHGYDALRESADWVRARVPEIPTVAVVLGSGLSAFSDRLEHAVGFEYAAIPHWPRTSAIGHPGKLVLGTVGGHLVAALAGRAHYYEGHDLRAVVFGVRVLRVLGAKVLILTNAAGGVNTAFERGSLMVIDDHINLLGSNPLMGPNDDRLGPRFPDMTEVYSRRLRDIADAAAAATGVRLEHGVYAGLHGPSYETPAEIRFLRTIGADAVGMSTVPEAIAARHMNMEVLGLSCVTNMAAGVLPEPLSHDEVLETTRRVAAEFARVLEEIIARL